MAPSGAFAEGAGRLSKGRTVKNMVTPQDFDALIQRGLETSAEAMRLVMLSIQTGYNLRAMEEQEKKAG